MNSHGLIATSFQVTDEVLCLGLKARAEYHAHMKEVTDAQKQKENEWAVHEEQKRMSETIEADKQRKKQLNFLEKKKEEHEKKLTGH